MSITMVYSISYDMINDVCSAAALNFNIYNIHFRFRVRIVDVRVLEVGED